jgi:hypothetical protein
VGLTLDPQLVRDLTVLIMSSTVRAGVPKPSSQLPACLPWLPTDLSIYFHTWLFVRS